MMLSAPKYRTVQRRMGNYTVDHANKVHFHGGNLSNWSSLPISFTPGPRAG